MKTSTPLLILILTAFLFLDMSPRRKEKKEKPAYLYCFYIKNGETGMHLAGSEDGLNWELLKKGKSWVKPGIGEYVIKDPFIYYGPDKLYHMIWSPGVNRKDLGYSNSKDLINWSAQRLIRVMDDESQALNCWAPEMIYDDFKQEYIIWWSSTLPGKFPQTDGQSFKTPDGKSYNNRIYSCSTKDFQTFGKASVFFDPGVAVTDFTIARDSLRYYAFFKDETTKPFPVRKKVKMATSAYLEGPYRDTVVIHGDYWAETPTAIKPDSSWIVYFDKFKTGKTGAIRFNKKMNAWKDISDSIKIPVGVRHGSILTIPGKLYKKLKEEE